MKISWELIMTSRMSTLCSGWYLYQKNCTETIQNVYKNSRKLYKTCTKLRLKTTWNLKCIYFVHTSNVQTTQNLYN